MNDPFASKYLRLLLERGFTIRSFEVQTEYNAKFDLEVEEKIQDVKSINNLGNFTYNLHCIVFSVISLVLLVSKYIYEIINDE